MKSISIQKLLTESNIQLIDVREPYEHKNGNIGGINIPMDQIFDSINTISRTKKVVVYCQSGRRASAVVYMLTTKYNMKNIINLNGGYEAYLNFKLN